jgi:hypothetical protein
MSGHLVVVEIAYVSTSSQLLFQRKKFCFDFAHFDITTCFNLSERGMVVLFFGLYRETAFGNQMF